MISLSEDSIMLNWKDSEYESPIVSIWCTAYNHEKYIERALDSFLSQITDFPFEIIVHDDASSDKTADIIREYEKRFPNIVNPIYETENQYSKHDGSIIRQLFERSKGKFIAICEGDDFLCDKMKLQKQFNYMADHDECSLCCHNTVIHDINEGIPDREFNDWSEVHTLTEEEIFFGWNVHTSSYLFRKEQAAITKEFDDMVFGDYVFLTLLRYVGEVVSLPDIMSVYNINVPTGATKQFYHADKSTYYNVIRSRIDYMKRYNIFTEGKFEGIVNLRIAELTLQVSQNEDELSKAARSLRKDKRYSSITKTRMKNQKISTKLKTWWKIYGSVFGKIWYWSLLFYFKRQNNGTQG